MGSEKADDDDGFFHFISSFILSSAKEGLVGVKKLITAIEWVVVEPLYGSADWEAKAEARRA